MPIDAYVDTNVFIRFFVKDNTEKAAGLKRLIQKAREGELVLHIVPIVILEIVWVLEKVYKWPKQEVIELIKALLNTPELKVEMKDVVDQAIKLYESTGIKFADAFIACWVKKRGGKRIYTYDKKHFKITGLEVEEP
ncbi:MAG: type II toxin-antitoxin system VapC family toxin [Candidatus Desulfofervidaceae bacterium]|nr:type II toxin-antitoxin system VapC family toxin [Candidatus Desulfofervidaceae bacterium]